MGANLGQMPAAAARDFSRRQGYAFAPHTFLKVKCIFVVVCSSFLKTMLHLPNIFLLNLDFTVPNKKKERKSQSIAHALKTKKTK